MAAEATITTKVYEWSHDPSKEVVVLTATDSETYKSVKFKTVLGVEMSVNEDDESAAAGICCSFTGQIVTLHGASLSDTLVCLTIYGRK